MWNIIWSAQLCLFWKLNLYLLYANNMSRIKKLEVFAQLNCSLFQFVVAIS